ncbi:MAG: ABC transporter permease [Acidobacteriota bacterium]
MVYMRLGTIGGLPYKTVLAGRSDIGFAGTAAFGFLWAVAAAGFVVAGAGLSAGADWWRPMTVGMAALSFALAVLDWQVAFVAVGLDLAVIAITVASALPQGRG